MLTMETQVLRNGSPVASMLHTFVGEEEASIRESKLPVNKALDIVKQKVKIDIAQDEGWSNERIRAEWKTVEIPVIIPSNGQALKGL